MRQFDKLLKGIIYKKNKGYKFHRYHMDESMRGQFFFSNDIMEEDVEIAKNILKITSVNNHEDLFLALTCVSLISAYEKRQASIAIHKGESVEPHKNYYAKKYVDILILFAMQNNVELSFYSQKDEKGRDITYIDFAGVQFSYHNCTPKESLAFNEKYGLGKFNQTTWNQDIKIQNGAKEIFTYALHLKNLSKLNYINETPLAYAESFKMWKKGSKTKKESSINGREV